MKLIEVPHIGLRSIDEFVYGGPCREGPDPAGCSDQAWAEHVFHRRGEPHQRREWWYHRPTGAWLVVARDTACDDLSPALPMSLTEATGDGR
jgi:sarcosine oxidase subunit delta